MRTSRRWVSQAYCRNNDVQPEVFYLSQEIDPDTMELLPIDEHDPAVAAQITLARAACDLCIVRQQCLDSALEAGIASGENVIWGGMTYEQRSVVRLARVARGEIGSVQAS